MKNLILISLFILCISINVNAQDTLPKGEGYVLVKMYDPFLNGKGLIFIILPSGESKVIECPVKPKGITSRDYEIDQIVKNETKLLEVIESYRKDGYELKAASSSNGVTSYLVLKK